MDRLAGKVAVITGGANGIGRDTALRFLDEGARVVIGDVNVAAAEAVLGLAEKRGQRDAIRFVKTDVGVESEVEAMIGCAVETFGRLDCVFNNAGIGGAFGPISETRVEEWDYSLAVLLRGVFLGMKHGARTMKAQGHGGSIISTASIAGLTGGGGAHCYSAAKAAIVSLTRTVAVELAPHRIRVNAIAPGPLLTDLYHKGRPAAAEQTILAKQPWPEAGRGTDVAGVALFLVSPDAGFVTGETIVVDGGLLARGPALFGSGAGSPLLKAAGLDKGSTGDPSEVRQIER